MERQQQIQQWLADLWPGRSFDLLPASADASFRRYFRAVFADNSGSHIVMDAPPENEDCRPFIHVATLLREAGLNAPVVLAEDLPRGFLLLSDLGRQTYLDVINGDNADALMRPAIAALVRWQTVSRPGVLPPYDEALLRRELALFPDWYCARHVSFDLAGENGKWRGILVDIENKLVANALAQPQVYVHRDWMPRNLMVSEPNPGILDFQDAVFGPISYDVISMLRDAFLSWDEEREIDWIVRYWEQAKRAGLPVDGDFAEFYRAAEWMGLQRHLKVLGIFARLNYRDGKPAYLADTPRFITYARRVANRYRPLQPLLQLLDALENRVVQIGYTF
jgi:aminoglycoside/choline kinase family phosphotransferase